MGRGAPVAASAMEMTAATIVITLPTTRMKRTRKSISGVCSKETAEVGGDREGAELVVLTIALSNGLGPNASGLAALGGVEQRFDLVGAGLRLVRRQIDQQTSA